MTEVIIMQKTKLSEHKKIGDTLHTPFAGLLGHQMQLSSWSQDKLPQYIWIALIFDAFGRKDGLNVLGQIMQDLQKKNICIAELSEVLALDSAKQTAWYNTVDLYVPRRVLCPLSLIFTSHNYPSFFDRYCFPDVPIEEKIDKLMKVIDVNLSYHSNQVTDICFILCWFRATAGKLSIFDGCEITIDAMTEYPKHTHSDEIMNIYGTSLRAMAQGICMNIDCRFSQIFWNTLSQITACNPMIINYNKEGMQLSTSYYTDCKKALEYIEATSNDKAQSVKFSVIMGLTTYIVKLYDEIISHDLSQTISARIIFRTMVEAYINLKYIIHKESMEPNIYDMFRNYGIGKYKLIMAKLREGKYSHDKASHLDPKIMELFANELKDENFLEISLGYFDKDSIKKKCEVVKENELYEIYYDYDTNYTHGFWGAIRESSMLFCDNPSHLYHAVPDYQFDQHLLDINADCIMLLKKLFNLISTYIELPDFYLAKYGENHD